MAWLLQIEIFCHDLQEKLLKSHHLLSQSSRTFPQHEMERKNILRNPLLETAYRRSEERIAGPNVPLYKAAFDIFVHKFIHTNSPPFMPLQNIIRPFS